MKPAKQKSPSVSRQHRLQSAQEGSEAHAREFRKFYDSHPPSPGPWEVPISTAEWVEFTERMNKLWRKSVRLVRPKWVKDAYTEERIKKLTTKAQMGVEVVARWDLMIQNCLEGMHSGKFACPDDKQYGILIRQFASAVYHGRHIIIREIAEALERVFARISSREKGKPIKFSAANPRLDKTVNLAKLSGTVSTSGTDIARAVAGAGEKPLSARHSQRIARHLGIKPGKRGRKKKPRLDASTEKKPHDSFNVRREFAAGYKRFIEKRPDMRRESVRAKRKP